MKQTETVDAGFGKEIEHKLVGSADATGDGVEITDAPKLGQKRVLVDLILSAALDMIVTIKEETSGTDIHGPFYLSANVPVQITTRATPMSKLPTRDKKYMAVASTGALLTIETWTYSEN